MSIKNVYSSPRRPYEKERLDQVCLHEIFPLANRCYFQELKLIGEFGLKNKREVWRVKYTLAKIRKAARELLTLEEKVTISNSLPVSVSCF